MPMAEAPPPLAAPPIAVAPIDTVDASLPTQLPRTAIPHHYAVTITPDAANMRFTGAVGIDLQVIQPTNQLVLNGVDLDVASASVSAPGAAPMPATVTMDADAQTITLAFPQTLANGNYHLDIAYSGKINTQAVGLFALDYKDTAGKPTRSLFTQFEASDARRMMPIWDEPDYKATWNLTAIVPEAQMAVGNMPIATSTPLGNGLKRVTFNTTPTMSSYLLFLAAGDVGRITKMAGDKEVGIVSSRGTQDKARTALDAEAQILPYYSDYFGIPFALPKLDNVAGPGESQFFGAMENWGAIFTFEYILLDDPAITTESQRQAIFSVEAHEMAHQWFGDLVTMAWWDDLWLNEGFASWMENRTTHHFHPDWGADIERIGAREAAMSQDAYVTTHPVVQQVRTVQQANQAFDSITYSKGESVISMLEAFAGPDVWQKGIRAYMQRHKYQNTRTDDLWNAVEGAGATGLTEIAHQFTLQPGVPLIRVGDSRCAGGQTNVTLAQGEFSADRKPGSFQPLTWKVPVTAATIGGTAVRTVATGDATQMSVPGCAPLLINAGQTGYFRTLYQPAQLKALTSAYGQLSAVDQYGLLHDNMTLSEDGYQPMPLALNMLSQVSAKSHPKLIGTAIGQWGGLYRLFEGDAATQAKIAKLVETRFAPVLKTIGMAPVDGEPALIATLRPTLISNLGLVGDKTVAAQARAYFAQPETIPGSLKSLWLSQIATNATPAEWERLHAMAKGASSATERSSFYSLLGRTHDEALARKALALALTDEPGSTVSASIIRTVAGLHPELALDFALANLPKVNDLVDSSSRSRFIARLGGESDKAETVGKLQAYAQANLEASNRKPVDAAIAQIRTALEHNPRIRTETKAWLSGNLPR
jgi:aminopeptidase N